MRLEFVPLLEVQRDLLDVPRGSARFARYLEVMGVLSGDITLPLAHVNPMGREHVALDRLLEMDAESIGRDAAARAAQRLQAVRGELRTGYVVADDAGGGWTERHLTEANHRFLLGGELKRGWSTALLWTSEQPSAAELRAEILAAVYRGVYQRSAGQPRTLGQMLRQEGLAAAFAGMKAMLDEAERERIRAVVNPHRDTTAYPALFACLYGDEGAVAAGYPSLGLPPRAGFELALADVLASGCTPELELTGSSAA